MIGPTPNRHWQLTIPSCYGQKEENVGDILDCVYIGLPTTLELLSNTLNSNNYYSMCKVAI